MISAELPCDQIVHVIGTINVTETSAARIFGKQAGERLHWLAAVAACAPDGS